MTIEAMLMTRAESKCELCSATADLSVYDVKPNAGPAAHTSALICDACVKSMGQMQASAAGEIKHWYCLNESMWSEHPAVKVLVYRVLKGLGDNSWAQDLLGQLYLDEETLKWADAGLTADDAESAPVLDSNGTKLHAGDTVTLIKDLDVKGANFTAKRGTTVKNIVLTDDPRYIEGRVNGTRIVLVAAYLKKA